MRRYRSKDLSSKSRSKRKNIYFTVVPNYNPRKRKKPERNLF